MVQWNTGYSFLWHLRCVAITSSDVKMASFYAIRKSVEQNADYFSGAALKEKYILVHTGRKVPSKKTFQLTFEKN